VSRHIEEYLSEKKLQPANGGSKSKLDAEQTVHLIAHLEDKTYVNTAEIVSYISTTYGVSYTEKGIYDWLLAHHFTYKKATGIPAKIDPVKQNGSGR
jgi:transposase